FPVFSFAQISIFIILSNLSHLLPKLPNFFLQLSILSIRNAYKINMLTLRTREGSHLNAPITLFSLKFNFKYLFTLITFGCLTHLKVSSLLLPALISCNKFKIIKHKIIFGLFSYIAFPLYC